MWIFRGSHNYEPSGQGLLLPHPAVLIFLWAGLTIAMQALPTATLLLAGLPLLLTAYVLSAVRLLKLLRRTRWIMLSLLLIYAYATPGGAVWIALAQFSPTWEGLADGLLQLFRLACALAGLAILLSLLPQQRLISGLYTLAYPLRYIGLSRERVAVRLALTLHYAESAIFDTAANWRSSIEQMLAPVAMNENSIKQDSIELHAIPFAVRDGLWLAAGCVVLAWVLL